MSNLQFSRSIEGNLPVEPVLEFVNPLSQVFGTFSYDKMTDGSQWTAVWLREDEIICEETDPWNGGTGGYGYTDCFLPGDKWLPGEYEVQMFIGEKYISGGRFTIRGDAATPTSTQIPTQTSTPISSPTPNQVQITPTQDQRATPTMPGGMRPDVFIITATGTPPSGFIP
jgi:hypothetical protein